MINNNNKKMVGLNLFILFSSLIPKQNLNLMYGNKQYFCKALWTCKQINNNFCIEEKY